MYIYLHYTIYIQIYNFFQVVGSIHDDYEIEMLSHENTVFKTNIEIGNHFRKSDKF